MRYSPTTTLIAGLVIGGCSGSPAPPVRSPFSTPTVASASTAHGATPMFAVTPAGDQVLSWVAADSASGIEQLHVQVRRTDGTVQHSVLTDPLGSIEPHGEAPPQVVAGPDGSIHALYTVGREVGKRFPESALRYARNVGGTAGWTTPVSINEGEAFGSHSFHALLAGGDGHLYATWLSSLKGSSGVWIRHSPDGGMTWQPARALHLSPSCPCCRTGLAQGRNGELYASWRRIFDGDVRDVVVARSADGGVRWEEPVRPRADNWVFPGCPHAGPSLRTASDGSVHVAWWTGVAGEAGVWYARSDDGGITWQAQPIAIGARSTPAHVQLAIGSADQVVVVWDDGIGVRPTVTLRASGDGGGSFGKAHVLSEPTVAATYPVLGIAGDTVVVAWTQVADAAHRAAMAARPDMHDPAARMPLPRVGQQQVVVRQAALSALLPGP